MTNKGLLTEFYIKNAIKTFFDYNLKYSIKSERPDFLTNKIGLEVTSLVEEGIAKPHLIYEKYKGKTIDQIPKSAFKALGCDKRNIFFEKSFYGIRDNNNVLRFVFNKEKKFVVYVHNPLNVPKMIRLLEMSLIKKQKKLQQKTFEKRKHNYLGVFIPNTFFMFKEEKAISDIFRTNYYKDHISKNKASFFNKVFIIFIDAIVENNISNETVTIKKINDDIYNQLFDESKEEMEDYLKKNDFII